MQTLACAPDQMPNIAHKPFKIAPKRSTIGIVGTLCAQIRIPVWIPSLKYKAIAALLVEFKTRNLVRVDVLDLLIG